MVHATAHGRAVSNHAAELVSEKARIVSARGAIPVRFHSRECIPNQINEATTAPAAPIRYNFRRVFIRIAVLPRSGPMLPGQLHSYKHPL
jgi:hypothetical protein